MVRAKRQPRAEANTRVPPSEVERKLYEVIKDKKNAGIWIKNLKKEACIHDSNVVKKALDALQNKKLIKMVANDNKGGQKVYMGFEFEPAKEISGGTCYIQGKLDTEFIGKPKKECAKHVGVMNVATPEMIWRAISKSSEFTTECSMEQINEILRGLVVDEEVEERN